MAFEILIPQLCGCQKRTSMNKKQNNWKKIRMLLGSSWFHQGWSAPFMPPDLTILPPHSGDGGRKKNWSFPKLRVPQATIGFNTTHRSGRLPGARVFSHETGLLSHGPSRSLRRVVAANDCETNHEADFVSCAWRGATPSVPSIPARRLEPRMKHVVKQYCVIMGER